jgi:hypothetical protein
VNVLAIYGVVVVAPTLGFWLVIRLMRWWTNWDGRRRPIVTPDRSSLQRLVDDLRRLEREYSRVERSDLPARAARLRALNLAYDDTLRACCHELGLPEPSERPLSGVVRLQTEAELAQHGLVW